MPSNKKNVLVTGFGLFGDYDVNSSWVAAQELALSGLGVDNYALEIKEIPVEYDAIDKIVDRLWKKHNPFLVVHVGVSGIAPTLTLEQCAHNTGYVKPDVKHKCPKNYCCKENGPSLLKSSINVQAIAESRQVKESGISVITSEDPGRYCCDYIYYSSLAMKRGHVIFVHVPPLNRPFNGKTLGIGLKAIIQAILEFIETNFES